VFEHFHRIPNYSKTATKNAFSPQCDPRQCTRASGSRGCECRTAQAAGSIKQNIGMRVIGVMN
jgi:hypothetical protein